MNADDFKFNQEMIRRRIALKKQRIKRYLDLQNQPKYATNLVSPCRDKSVESCYRRKSQLQADTNPDIAGRSLACVCPDEDTIK